MSIFEDRPFIPKLEQKALLKDKPKVGRYWPGKAPGWADEQEESDEENDIESASAAPVKVERKSDRRLQRIQGEGAVDKEEALRRRRNREVVAEIVSVAKKEEPMDEEDEEDEDDHTRSNRNVVGNIVTIKQELPDEEIEDDADARRERARQKLKKKAEEEEAMPIEDQEDEEKQQEEEEESEYETDSDSDDFPSRPTIQPVFVKRTARETIEERDKRFAEEEKAEQERLKQQDERKVESRRLVAKAVVDDAIALKNMEEDVGDERIESDEEEEDEAKEYELWKQRELARIKRDKDEREAMEHEKEETERRRHMSDAEIRQLDKDKFVKVKKQWNFLQKYYHKGAFFREGDQEDIQNRDFSGPVGEDHIDKAALPKIMQVKNFGRSGQTKYTHLTDQDTTQMDAPWARADSYTPEFTQKLGGMHGGFERPAAKKRKQEG